MLGASYKKLSTYCIYFYRCVFQLDLYAFQSLEAGWFVFWLELEIRILTFKKSQRGFWKRISVRLPVQNMQLVIIILIDLHENCHENAPLILMCYDFPEQDEPLFMSWLARLNSEVKWLYALKSQLISIGSHGVTFHYWRILRAIPPLTHFFVEFGLKGH